MTEKRVWACDLRRDDPALRRMVKRAWKDKGGLPKDADLIGPMDWDIPGLYGAYYASLDWLDPPAGFDYGQDPKERLLRAMHFQVLNGESAGYNAAARACGIKEPTVRAWMSRKPELHERAEAILRQEFDWAELWPLEETVRDLDRLACLVGVEEDIAALRRGMGPRQEFLLCAHKGKLPEDLLPKVVTFST